MIKIVSEASTQIGLTNLPKIMDWKGEKIIVLGKNKELGDYNYFVFNINSGAFKTNFNIPGIVNPTDYNEPITIQNA